MRENDKPNVDRCHDPEEPSHRPLPEARRRLRSTEELKLGLPYYFDIHSPILPSSAVRPTCPEVGPHYTFLRSRRTAAMALKITINPAISLSDRGDAERWHGSRRLPVKRPSHAWEARSRGPCLGFAMFKNERNAPSDSMFKHEQRAPKNSRWERRKGDPVYHHLPIRQPLLLSDRQVISDELL